MLAACRVLAPGGRGGPRGGARAGLAALTGVRARIKRGFFWGRPCLGRAARFGEGPPVIIREAAARAGL